MALLRQRRLYAERRGYHLCRASAEAGPGRPAKPSQPPAPPVTLLALDTTISLPVDVRISDPAAGKVPAAFFGTVTARRAEFPGLPRAAYHIEVISPKEAPDSIRRIQMTPPRRSSRRPMCRQIFRILPLCHRLSAQIPNLPTRGSLIPTCSSPPPMALGQVASPGNTMIWLTRTAERFCWELGRPPIAFSSMAVNLWKTPRRSFSTPVIWALAG